MTVQTNVIDFRNLIFPRWKINPLKIQPKKPIKGFDTETLDGYIKLIADNTGEYLYDPNAEEVLRFLSRFSLRSSHNFFFNLSYDYDSLFKMLPENNIEEITHEGQTEYKNYTIRVIPKKLLTIKKNKQIVSYYDIAQFYETSLKKASKIYLNRNKNEDKLDRALIGTKINYWNQHLNQIIEYCIDDAKLCQLLSLKLRDEIATAINFYPKNYVSKASLTKQFFRMKSEIPYVRDIPTPVLEAAFNSYHGGRFEVIQRGYQGKCSEYDIVSAYPSIIANLIDISKGKWLRVNCINDKAYYGYYLATIEQKGGYYGLLPYRYKETKIYPIGKWTGWFSKKELTNATYHADVEVLSGFEFYPTEIRFPFRDAMLEIYKKKEKCEKRTYEYQLYKKIMNALYGSFYEKIKTSDGKMKAGMFFNPVYASEITSQTRVQLLDYAYQAPEKVLSYATDSVVFKGNPKIKEEGGFGKFEKDKTGETTILKSGIYSIGDTLKQRGIMKKKFLNTPYGKYENIFDYIKKYPDFHNYPIISTRPIHSRECIIHNKKYGIKDINIFTEIKTTFNLNTEIKRCYKENNITGNDILTRCIKSTPYIINNNLVFNTN